MEERLYKDGLTFFDLDALGLEQVPEPADLVLELPDELGVAVLVHHRLAHDLLGSAHAKNVDSLILKIRKTDFFACETERLFFFSTVI
jgi:hypothetical protein